MLTGHAWAVSQLPGRWIAARHPDASAAATSPCPPAPHARNRAGHGLGVQIMHLVGERPNDDPARTMASRPDSRYRALRARGSGTAGKARSNPRTHPQQPWTVCHQAPATADSAGSGTMTSADRVSGVVTRGKRHDYRCDLTRSIRLHRGHPPYTVPAQAIRLPTTRSPWLPGSGTATAAGSHELRPRTGIVAAGSQGSTGFHRSIRGFHRSIRRGHTDALPWVLEQMKCVHHPQVSRPVRPSRAARYPGRSASGR